jgi:hypothetical protein
MSLDAMQNGAGTYGYPEFNINEAQKEGRYVHFMENCCQWDLMTYVHHPYYWNNKGDWDEVINLYDKDPIFQKFLQSGYSEVRVAVTPGFEAHVMYLLKTGKIWFGTDAPVIEGLTHEVAEIIDSNRNIEVLEDGKPEGFAWSSIIPTSEVYLVQPMQLDKFTGVDNDGNGLIDNEGLNGLYELDEPFKL